MYVDMSFGFYCSVHLNSNSNGFTSFGPGLTLLSVLGKMLRLVEDDADFSRFLEALASLDFTLVSESVSDSFGFEIDFKCNKL